MVKKYLMLITRIAFQEEVKFVEPTGLVPKNLFCLTSNTMILQSKWSKFLKFVFIHFQSSIVQAYMVESKKKCLIIFQWAIKQ